jgi:hypothetical protein
VAGGIDGATGASGGRGAGGLATSPGGDAGSSGRVATGVAGAPRELHPHVVPMQTMHVMTAIVRCVSFTRAPMIADRCPQKKRAA